MFYTNPLKDYTHADEWMYMHATLSKNKAFILEIRSRSLWEN